MKEEKTRNRQIRREYRKGLGTILGNQYGITRQRIHTIVSTIPHQTPQDGRQGSLIHRWVALVRSMLKRGE